MPDTYVVSFTYNFVVPSNPITACYEPYGESR